MNDDVFNHAHPSKCPFTPILEAISLVLLHLFHFFLAFIPPPFNTQKLVLSLVTTERDSCFDVKKRGRICLCLSVLPSVSSSFFPFLFLKQQIFCTETSAAVQMSILKPVYGFCLD
ncbi:unnamed protein product [Meloidogyne enterolobii]|uniref:Uncharacterized protein n=1 Tax=Meloidogyne enterolobii TaxID=390850 RepID=A0ACB0YLB2_MELEN